MIQPRHPGPSSDRRVGSSLAVRSLRALVLLTGATLRRSVREGLVLRSMLWPGLVTLLTLAVTLALMAAIRPGRTIAVTEDEDPAMIAALVDREFIPRVVDDPQTAVERDCSPSIGLVANPAAQSGYDLWLCGIPVAGLEVEGLLRERVHAPWRPVPPRPPDPKTRNLHGDLVCRVLGLLFVLYGLVFGLGGVARDRDDGSLEAELSLPIPRWIGGLARWVASSLVLGTFYTVSILTFSAMIVVQDWDAVLRHGLAASAVGVAIGLSVVGTAGLKNGFSGPLALGMTGATGLAAVGAVQAALNPELGAIIAWVPIASLFTSGSGWVTLGVAGVVGLGSAWLYGWRAGSA